MAAPVYTYILDDAITGNHLAEVNLTGVQYSYGLNGSGSFTGTMGLLDPNAALLKTLSVDMLVLRDGVPVFSGPITGLQASASGSTVSITASPVWWWMQYRTMELSRDYTNADMAFVFDDILTTVNGKFSGDIRLTKSASYNSGTGQTITRSFDATARPIAGQVISDLSQLYPGFDWYISLRLDPTTGKCLREYNVYAPFKGSLVDQALTQANLADLGQTDDGTRVYNRVHELGSGSGNTQMIVSQSNYIPTSYFNSGTNDSPPVSSGTGGISTDNGYPAPSWYVRSGGYRAWTTNLGVGSTIDFDCYFGGLSSAGYGGTQNGSYFYFGCNSSGSGNAFCPWINYDSTTNRMGTVATGSWGTSVTSQASLTRSNAAPLAGGNWHHTTIQIASTTTAKVWVDGEALYSYQSSSGVCDGLTFPISLNGTYFGIFETGSSNTYIDNIAITAPTASYSTPSIPYIERVVSRSDIGDVPSLRLYAQADLYLGAWPSLTYTASFVPSAALPFGFCSPGDTVPIDYSYGPYLVVSGTKRVISIAVSVGDGGSEVVSLSFNDTHA